MEKPDLSIVMPCRNEETAVGFCVDDAKTFLRLRGLRGEVIVADNGSVDESKKVAMVHGARVVTEERPGYGLALRKGIAESRGRVIILGDSDTTYDFLRLEALYDPLTSGECDMMIGDRFAGGIEPGAMALSHRIGVKALSMLGRMCFRSKVRDFHCGLRGLTWEAAQRLEFRTEGMEFATEMIALGEAAGLRIGQCPVTLRKCSTDRKSKLRTLPDGFRHLQYMLHFCCGLSGKEKKVIRW